MNFYLLIFIILSFLLIFVLPSYKTYRETKSNPITFGKEDNAHNYIGKIFKILILLIFIVLVFNAFFEDFYEKYIVPIHYLESKTFFYLGFFLLHFSVLWIMVAQFQMGKSWRIGIDEKNKAELITKGLFSISRNPVFLGMIVMLFSIFLVLPNIITFFTFLSNYILIQIQIRLEEDFLKKTFGETYHQYQLKTRRLL